MHSALGRINDIDVVSNTLLVQHGNAMRSNKKLNFPYPVFAIAVSKSLPISSVGWI